MLSTAPKSSKEYKNKVKPYYLQIIDLELLLQIEASQEVANSDI